MPVCIVTFDQIEKANQLNKALQDASTPLANSQLIKPKRLTTSSLKTQENISASSKEEKDTFLSPVDISTVELLSPRLAKQKYQRNMALWLMPFGFVSGLTFTKMTGLTTFSDLGIGYLGESFTGGIIGMASGWIGSYFASSSIAPINQEDIDSLHKKSETGLWLLLLETPEEIELPWKLLTESEPIEIVRLLNQ